MAHIYRVYGLWKYRTYIYFTESLSRLWRLTIHLEHHSLLFNKRGRCGWNVRKPWIDYRSANSIVLYSTRVVSYPSFEIWDLDITAPNMLLCQQTIIVISVFCVVWGNFLYVVYFLIPCFHIWSLQKNKQFKPSEYFFILKSICLFDRMSTVKTKINWNGSLLRISWPRDRKMITVLKFDIK